MDRVAETAELLGVEASIGTNKLEIGSATKDFIAGAISGMVGICAGQPLDTIRVRMQQKKDHSIPVGVSWQSGAKNGVRDLFRGMSYPLSTIALQNAVTFQAQGAAARVLTSSESRTVISWQHTCISGMFAGAMSSFISSPTELLKIRMQLQKPLPGTPGYMGAWPMLQHVMQHEGVMGLTRGLGTTLVRDIPSYGVYFCVYHFSVQGLGQLLFPLPNTVQQPLEQQPLEQQQQQPLQQPPQGQEGQQQLPLPAGQSSPGQVQGLQQHTDKALSNSHQQLQQSQQMMCQQPPPQQQQQHPGASQPLAQFIAGGLAGAVAWASIYPIDVVKSRLQATSKQASVYTGAWHCAVSCWREEGAQVFVKGFWATIGRGFVVNAAIFVAFEALMSAMSE